MHCQPRRNRSAPPWQGGIRGGFIRKTFLDPNILKGIGERLRLDTSNDYIKLFYMRCAQLNR